MSKPRLNRSQYGRLRRLLNMLYKPSELAEETGISVDSLYRSFIPAGAPVKVDSSGRIWINGKAFEKWVHDYLTIKRKNKQPMKDNEAYCTRCNAIVEASGVKIAPYKQGIRMLSGRCSVCNAKVNRFLKVEKPAGVEDEPR